MLAQPLQGLSEMFFAEGTGDHLLPVRPNRGEYPRAFWGHASHEIQSFARLWHRYGMIEGAHWTAPFFLRLRTARSARTRRISSAELCCATLHFIQSKTSDSRK